MSIPQDVGRLAHILMDELDCPGSRRVRDLLGHGPVDELGLASLEACPSDYQFADDYFRDAIAYGLLRKFQELNTGDKEARTLENFYSSERMCFLTNLRLYPFIDNTYDENGAALLPFLDRVRKEVIGVIGTRPPHPSKIQGCFGPGSTVSDKSGYTTVAHKLSSSPTITPQALPFLPSWARTLWGRTIGARKGEVGVCIDVVAGGNYFMVPKNAKVFRGCSTEPSINAYYQRGYGKVIADRLAEKGLDLASIQDKHRALALAGSSGALDLATIDLRNASDTMAKALVELVLPCGWFAVLDQLRSHKTRLPSGQYLVLEKFSSMGNGFTFELETLLFYAIAKAAGAGFVSVCGDDIIVDTASAGNVVTALRFLGFETNAQKTFLSGPFRESCGGDFFRGSPVRPYNLTEAPASPLDWISVANQIRRVGLDLGGGVVNALPRTWRYCLSMVPAPLRRLRGPVSLGDIVIHDHRSRWETAIKQHKDALVRSRELCVKSLRRIPGNTTLWDRFGSDTQMAFACYPSFHSAPTYRDGKLVIPGRGREPDGWEVCWTPLFHHSW